MDHTSKAWEERHLGEVLDFVRRSAAQQEENKRILDKEIDGMLAHYNSDNQDLHIALVVATDRQRELEGLLGRYARASRSPFFGRVDFREDGEETVQRLYIGRQGLFDESARLPIVVDWRTPAANLYYDALPGPASYRTQDGPVCGELSLKRTYTIENGELTAFFDADTVANDVLLQEYLSRSADAVLRDIVATIQKDQNDIIRLSPSLDVIVQGVAGSGKTTVAMHRLAYLLFNHADTLKPGQFVIIGTNRMFLSYVSGMLPDLGVESVQQMVMPQLLAWMLHLEPRVTAVEPALRACKTSHAYFEQLRQFVDDFEDALFLSGDLYLGDALLMTADQIRERVIGQRRHSMEDRAAQLKSILTLRVEQQLPRLLNRLQAECDEALARLRAGEPAGFDSPAAVIDYKYARTEQLRKQARELPAACVKKLRRTDEHRLYQAFVRQLAKSERPDLALCASRTRRALREGRLDLYDLAALFFIAARLYAPSRAAQFRHLVIDEAQDFGPMLFDCLCAGLPGATFTVLGDVSQNLSGDAGIDDWDSLLTTAFSARRHRFCVLSKSYRNTIEIAGVANTVLSHSPARRFGITPVVRHGEPAVFTACADPGALLDIVREELGAHTARARGSLALLCADAARARRLHEALRDPRLRLLVSDGPEDALYEGGASVFDIQSVKGLEFDRVILCGAGTDDYPADAAGVRALYVACTRALHSLRVLYVGRCSPLFTPAG